MKLALCVATIALIALSSCQMTDARFPTETKFGGVYSGMSTDAVRGVLGEPDSVDRTNDHWHKRTKFMEYFSISGGGYAVEWAWTKRDPIIVVWIQADAVALVGHMTQAEFAHPKESVRNALNAANRRANNPD